MTATRGIVLLVCALVGACKSSSTRVEAGPRMSLVRYGALQDDLDPGRFAQGYPALVHDLQSEDPAERCQALRMLAASDEVDAIPFVVEAMLGTEDRAERTWAACALRDIVAHHELKRRDFARPTGVHLLPRTPSHVDLRPLAWVVEEMLAMDRDDTNVCGSAATIVGYVGMKQFADELTALMDSPHPAMRNSVRYALALLEQVDDDGNVIQSADRGGGPAGH